MIRKFFTNEYKMILNVDFNYCKNIFIPYKIYNNSKKIDGRKELNE